MASRIVYNGYWQKRVQQEEDKMYRASVKSVENELKDIYQQQSEILINNINKVYLKMENDAKTRGEPYLNDMFRIVRYGEFLEEFNKRAKAIGGKQNRIQEKELIAVYDQAKDTVGKYAPEAGIVFVKPERVSAKDAVKVAWCLDGRNFSDRIWADKEELVKSLYKTTEDCVMRGETVYTITKEIQKRLNVSLSNAYRLARTETAHAQISANVARYKEMGWEYGKVSADRYSDRTCEECLDLDGQIFTLDEIETKLPIHPSCRCSFVLVNNNGDEL